MARSRRLKPPVWKRSFGLRRASDTPELIVFGIGAHLGELIEDLRQAGAAQAWIETLNGDFGNLRAAVADDLDDPGLVAALDRRRVDPDRIAAAL